MRSSVHSFPKTRRRWSSVRLFSRLGKRNTVSPSDPKSHNPKLRGRMRAKRNPAFAKRKIRKFFSDFNAGFLWFTIDLCERGRFVPVSFQSSEVLLQRCRSPAEDGNSAAPLLNQDFRIPIKTLRSSISHVSCFAEFSSFPNCKSIASVSDLICSANTFNDSIKSLLPASQS